MLLYFKLKTNDLKEIEHLGKFNFKLTEERIGSLREELSNLTEFNSLNQRQNKLKRILKTYDEMNLQ